MLHNVLVRQLGLPAVAIDAALAAVGIDRDRRPQTLSVDGLDRRSGRSLDGRPGR